jgi:hypothetical protein
MLIREGLPLIFCSAGVRRWQILLQKSQKAQRLIFRQTTKQATIANQQGFKRANRMACSLGLGDVVPHIIIRSLHLRVGKFESHPAKKLLQQYRHEPDMPQWSLHVRYEGKSGLRLTWSTG